MNYDQYLNEASNKAFTENGALSYASTLNACLDLFALGAASRNMDKTKVINLIDAAFQENKEIAFRVLFYLADIREGQGEREFFKIALTHLVNRHPELIKAIVSLIPEYTRWDYLYTLVGTSVEDEVIRVIKDEYTKTQASGETSLMYKWLKSTNTSSKESVRLGKWTADILAYPKSYAGLKAYQHMLRRERSKLNDAVVETKLSRNNWEDVDYSKVASKASLKYKRAFERHDKERYSSFIDDVLSGKQSMNASVTYPHEIVYAYTKDGFYEPKMDLPLEALWKSLPKYINSNENVIAVVDTSGSMTRPISKSSKISASDVAFALGAYTAQYLTGPFKGKVITFSEEARYINLFKFGTSLFDILRSFYEHRIVENTNIQSVFDLILYTALSHHVPQTELPSKVIIISDMQFDDFQSEQTNFDLIKEKYESANYVMPELVFWNVNARNTEFPVTQFEKGVALVSGYSPSLLEEVLSGQIKSPIDHMLKTIMTDRYDVISLKINSIT